MRGISPFFSPVCTVRVLVGEKNGLGRAEGRPVGARREPYIFRPATFGTSIDVASRPRRRRAAGRDPQQSARKRAPRAPAPLLPRPDGRSAAVVSPALRWLLRSPHRCLPSGAAHS